MLTVNLTREEKEKEFVNYKVEMINRRLAAIKDKSQIVIWGGGIQTQQLMIYSELPKYGFTIVDNNMCGTCMTHTIERPESIKWETVTAVILGAHKAIDEITYLIRNKYGYDGEIIFLYEEDEIWDFWKLNKSENSCWWGDFQSFDEAKKYADIWNPKEILKADIELQLNSMKYPVNWYWTQWIQKNLLRIYIESGKNCLSVIDFGGGVGQEYFNDKEILNSIIKNMEWCVVDQADYVEFGKKNLVNSQLAFEATLTDAREWLNNPCSVLLMIGCLQYFEDYKKFIREIFEYKIPYIVIARLQVAERQRICIQNMGVFHAKSAYCILNEKEFLQIMSEQYEVIDELEYWDKPTIFSTMDVREMCWVFKRKE